MAHDSYNISEITIDEICSLIPLRRLQHLFHNPTSMSKEQYRRIKNQRETIMNKIFSALPLANQQQEIDKLLQQNEDPYSAANYRITVGSIYEYDFLDILRKKGLQATFYNSSDTYINFTDKNISKVYDVIVKHKDKYIGVDIKYGTIWKTDTNSSQIYVKNEGLHEQKFAEIYKEYPQEFQMRYNQPIRSYIALVCYDLLEKYSYNHYNEYYKNIFGNIPYGIEDVIFLVDIESLFKEAIDNFETTPQTYTVFNKKAPCLLNINSHDNRQQYAIKLNSSECTTLREFVDNLYNY